MGTARVRNAARCGVSALGAAKIPGANFHDRPGARGDGARGDQRTAEAGGDLGDGHHHGGGGGVPVDARRGGDDAAADARHGGVAAVHHGDADHAVHCHGDDVADATRHGYPAVDYLRALDAAAAEVRVGDDARDDGNAVATDDGAAVDADHASHFDPRASFPDRVAVTGVGDRRGCGDRDLAQDSGASAWAGRDVQAES